MSELQLDSELTNLTQSEIQQQRNIKGFHRICCINRIALFITKTVSMLLMFLQVMAGLFIGAMLPSFSVHWQWARRAAMSMIKVRRLSTFPSKSALES